MQLHNDAYSAVTHRDVINSDLQVYIHYCY